MIDLSKKLRTIMIFFQNLHGDTFYNFLFCPYRKLSDKQYKKISFIIPSDINFLLKMEYWTLWWWIILRNLTRLNQSTLSRTAKTVACSLWPLITAVEILTLKIKHSSRTSPLLLMLLTIYSKWSQSHNRRWPPGLKPYGKSNR